MGGRFEERKNRGLRHAKPANRLMDISLKNYHEEWLSQHKVSAAL